MLIDTTMDETGSIASAECAFKNILKVLVLHSKGLVYSLSCSHY